MQRKMKNGLQFHNKLNKTSISKFHDQAESLANSPRLGNDLTLPKPVKQNSIEVLLEGNITEEELDTLMEKEMRNTATSLKRSPAVVQRDAKHVGPLKLDPEYQGPNQFMFRNVGRNTFYNKQDQKIKNLPHCNRYNPNSQLVAKNSTHAIKFSSSKKDTSENMIRISNCISTLDQKFLDRSLQKDRDLLRKIRNISQMEQNLGKDVYLPNQQKKVLQILNQNYSKYELKLAKTSVEGPIIQAIKNSSQSPQTA